ncbi:MAG TPA: hypothetical protein VMT18_11755, partial [Planctomycetota bacterium]|nr:hypothetical protein [Planctomycetota bacterium]
MNAKLWIWSSVVLVSAGVGVPVVWRNVTREAPPEPLDLPAEGGMDEDLVFAASFDEVPAPPRGDPGEDESARPAPPVDATLDVSLGRIERLLPRGGGGMLDRLARGELGDADVPPLRDDPHAVDALGAFVEQHPLCGILQAPDGAVALFGGQRLRVGETFLGGRARVIALDARGVRVEFEGDERA